MTRPASVQRLMVLVSATALSMVALGTFHAAATTLTPTTVRIAPSLNTAPFVNNIGSGIGAHTDRVWGHPDGGGTQGISECHRRADQRLDKRASRRNCGDY